MSNDYSQAPNNQPNNNPFSFAPNAPSQPSNIFAAPQGYGAQASNIYAAPQGYGVQPSNIYAAPQSSNNSFSFAPNAPNLSNNLFSAPQGYGVQSSDIFAAPQGYGVQSTPVNNNPKGDFNRLGPKDYTKEIYAEKKIAAVIITTNAGSSYDALYQSLEQTPPDPEQYVSVYAVHYAGLKSLLKAFSIATLLDSNNNNSNNNNETASNNIDEIFAELKETDKVIIKELLEELTHLNGENVVLNFECCGSCTDSGFSGKDETIFGITKLAIDKKFITMFSDFSLKALIGKWDSSKLGPNPFKSVGSFSSNFTLEFDPKTLIDCPFAQLQNVGELCEKGRAVSHAMGGTILYTVIQNDLQRQNCPYKLTTLTVVSVADGQDYSKSPHAIKVGEKKGLAGHVTLEYENGGKILTSCGHWIELIKLDVSMESVISHAQKQYGEVYAQNLSTKLSSLSGAAQSEELRNVSNRFVQSSAPCSYNKY